MRLRNVKDKDVILNGSNVFINNPSDYKSNWKSIFKNNNDIYIEIGSGKCGFIYNLAKANPNINFVGVEKFASALALGFKKYDMDLDNLKIINVDAMELGNIFDHEIKRIYLNFSDPWPKKRHAKRRLTSLEFLKCYDNLFDGDKVIFQKTDNRKLFEFSLESLSSYGYVINEIHLDLHNDQIDDNINTEYEEKFVKKGMPIFMVKVTKKALK